MDIILAVVCHRLFTFLVLLLITGGFIIGSQFRSDVVIGTFNSSVSAADLGWIEDNAAEQIAFHTQTLEKSIQLADISDQNSYDSINGIDNVWTIYKVSINFSWLYRWIRTTSRSKRYSYLDIKVKYTITGDIQLEIVDRGEVIVVEVIQKSDISSHLAPPLLDIISLLIIERNNPYKTIIASHNTNTEWGEAKAIKLAKDLIKRSSKTNQALAMNYLAGIRRKDRDAYAAVELLNSALRIDPELFIARYSLIQLAIEKLEYDRARELLEEALKESTTLHQKNLLSWLDVVLSALSGSSQTDSVYLDYFRNYSDVEDIEYLAHLNSIVYWAYHQKRHLTNSNIISSLIGMNIALPDESMCYVLRSCLESRDTNLLQAIKLSPQISTEKPSDIRIVEASNDFWASQSGSAD